MNSNTGAAESDWRDNMPRSVLDPCGPRGEPITTPTDRRMLWHLENVLAVSVAYDSELGQLARDLRRYLTETCEHHWLDYDESRWQHPDTGEVQDVIPVHRQCLWCHDVEWAADAAPEAGQP